MPPLLNSLLLKIFRAIKELQIVLQSFRAKNLSTGFVPTMGALHQGHIALIKQSAAQHHITVCSIFVNPTQFNNPDDLVNYPRTEKADLNLLQENECNIVFIPEVKEMYPDKKLLDLNFGSLETVMEGAFRPGHFKGVATVVNKLFQIVEPDAAYFGEKDFQQLAVIRNMVNQLNLKVKITGCATVREQDGLAMSSRNVHLTSDERANAAIIYQSLLKSKNDYLENMLIKEIKNNVVERIEQTRLFKVQYFEIVNAISLQPLDRTTKAEPVQACIAVLTSKTRLIDNIALSTVRQN